MLIDPLGLNTPLGGFNGGLVVDPAMNILQELIIRDELVGPIIDVLTQFGLSVWLYQGTHWYVLDHNGPHVEHESAVCAFGPREVDSFEPLRGDIIKIVGVSDNPTTIANATAELVTQFGRDVSATSSQTYYIDVTHQDANKGHVVGFLAKLFTLDPKEIVTIGDMGNDVLMFEKSGESIAMGNASNEVKGRATHVSRSNDDDGFAFALNHFVLGDAS
jgi:Cof subfamily protein (haloacid dehalogenase superfamily)